MSTCLFAGFVMLFSLCVVQPFASGQDKFTNEPIVLTLYSPRGMSLPVIDLPLTSHTVGHFVVDTGSSVSIITDALADTLQLAHKPAVDRSGKNITLNNISEMVTVQNLKVGVVSLSFVNFLLINQKHWSQIVDRKIDGLIGTDVLSQFIVRMDFAQKKLFLWLNNALPDDFAAQIGFNAEYSTRFANWQGTNVYVVRATFSGATNSDKEWLIVDTGSDYTRISSDLAADLGLVPLGTIKNNQTMQGTERLTVITPRSITVANITVLGTKVVYGEMELIHPTLGLDFLTSYEILLDFKGGKAYFKPPDKNKKCDK